MEKNIELKQYHIEHNYTVEYKHNIVILAGSVEEALDHAESVSDSGYVQPSNYGAHVRKPRVIVSTTVPGGEKHNYKIVE